MAVTEPSRPDGPGSAGAARPSIAIADAGFVVTTPEGKVVSAPIGEVLRGAVPRRLGDVVWPTGVKLCHETGWGAVVVHETPPRIHSLKWITPDSPRDFGRGTQYGQVRIALPYVLIVACFVADGRGRLQLVHGNHCYFMTRPLRDPRTDVPCYPALLNCSRYNVDPAQHPLSWICTQHLDMSPFAGQEDGNARLRAGLEALHRHLFSTGFNKSSEHHERSSWYTATVEAGVDERIADMERWQQATADDPRFVCDVPWLSTGHSLLQIVEYLGRRAAPDHAPIDTDQDLIRWILNHSD